MLLVHLLSQMAVLIIGRRPTGLLNAVLGRSLISQQNLVEARRVIKRSKALSACSPEQLPVTQEASFSRPGNFLYETL